MTPQNPYHDMHAFNPQYSVAPEVSNEFNLLTDFLTTSLIDDGTPGLDDQLSKTNQPSMGPGFLDSTGASNLLPPSAMTAGSMLPPSAEQAASFPRPASAAPVDKTREYYLQAADPSGDDNPGQRMMRLLKAKHEAGLLKPFSYVNGYARLYAYLDSHRVAPASKQRIQRQLDKFRPTFREKMHALTDLELVSVEMWFESALMEYDRVFASMAVPACCWRRTGEIVRGNKEMAELIHVPVERLRDVRCIPSGPISSCQVLTGLPGQDFPPRDPNRGLGRPVLGRVRHHRFRPCTRHPVDGVCPEEPRRPINGTYGGVLLLDKNPTRRAQDVGYHGSPLNSLEAPYLPILPLVGANAYLVVRA